MFYTNGYANKVTLSYWSFVSDNQASITDDSGNRNSIDSGHTTTLPINYLRGCRGHEYSVSLFSNGQNKDKWAFLLINEKTFTGISLYQTNPDISIVNNHPVELDVSASDPTNELGLWRDCFQIDLMEHNETGLSVNQLDCDNAGSKVCEIATDNNKILTAKYLLTPGSVLPQDISNVQDIPIDIALKTTWDNQLLAPTISVNVPVYFQPRFSSTKPTFTSGWEFGQPLDDNETVSLSFDYTSSSPNIYLVTSKNSNEITTFEENLTQTQNYKDQTWATCPKDTNKISDELAVNLIPNKYSVNDLENRYAIISSSSNQITFSGKYNLEAKKFVLSQQGCGYGTLVFEWGDQGSLLGAIWSCDLLKSPINCKRVDSVDIK